MKLLLDLFNSWIILALIFFIVAVAWAKGIKVYEEFVKGAKEGFDTAVMIIPYLVAILCAVAFFTAGGAMDVLKDFFAPFTARIDMDPSLVPLAILRPLSGGGSRGILVDIWEQMSVGGVIGADTMPGLMASVMQGSTETTFYVLAVYCGSVNIRKTRGVLGPLLLGDLAGFIVTVLVCNYFFGHLFD